MSNRITQPGRSSFGRTIWASAVAMIPTRGICSASWRKVPTVSSEFLTILNEVYPAYLQLPPQWSAQEQQDWLEREAERLSRMTGELTDQLAEQVVADWKRSHGRHPDYLTTVGLLRNAQLSAREQILHTELYEQIPVTEQDEEGPGENLDGLMPEDPGPPPAGTPWHRRWTVPGWLTDPSEELELLIEQQIWPNPAFSTLFRIKAGWLLAARIEDGLPIPASSEEPLARELAQMIYADLRRDGLPEH